jgi:hypothetical protein
MAVHLIAVRSLRQRLTATSRVHGAYVQHALYRARQQKLVHQVRSLMLRKHAAHLGNLAASQQQLPLHP